MKAFSEKPFYTWFTGETDRERAEGLWECLKELKQIIEEYGPYDGIYGFSFGALLATILASEDTWQELFGQGIQIRFVLLACAGMLLRKFFYISGLISIHLRWILTIYKKCIL